MISSIVSNTIFDSLAFPSTLPSMITTGAKPQAPRHLVASYENKPSSLVPLTGA